MVNDKQQTNELISATETHNNTSDRGQRVFKGSLLITASFAVLVIIGLVISLSYTNIQAIDQFMASIHLWLSYWRLLVFVVIFGGWNIWSALYAKWSGMTAQQLQHMLDCRWRLALWVMVMELLFSQKLLSQFANSLLGTGG